MCHSSEWLILSFDVTQQLESRAHMQIKHGCGCNRHKYLSHCRFWDVGLRFGGRYSLYPLGQSGVCFETQHVGANWLVDFILWIPYSSFLLASWHFVFYNRGFRFSEHPTAMCNTQPLATFRKEVRLVTCSSMSENVDSMLCLNLKEF